MESTYHDWTQTLDYEGVINSLPYHQKRFHWILDQIDFPSITKNKNVLEVAFNNGKTLFWALERYGQIFKCSMFDFDPRVINWAKENNKKWDIDIFESDVQHIKKPDESFDFIFCLDVIEHLPDTVYRQMIKELYRLLEKNGQILVLIGKGKSFSHIHTIPDDEAIKDFEREGFHFLDKFSLNKSSVFWRVVKK